MIVNKGAQQCSGFCVLCLMLKQPDRHRISVLDTRQENLLTLNLTLTSDVFMFMPQNN